MQPGDLWRYGMDLQQRAHAREAVVTAAESSAPSRGPVDHTVRRQCRHEKPEWNSLVFRGAPEWHGDTLFSERRQQHPQGDLVGSTHMDSNAASLPAA